MGTRGARDRPSHGTDRDIGNMFLLSTTSSSEDVARRETLGQYLLRNRYRVAKIGLLLADGKTFVKAEPKNCDAGKLAARLSRFYRWKHGGVFVVTSYVIIEPDAHSRVPGVSQHDVLKLINA